MSRKHISLTVGYDAKRAYENLTGLGNYSRYVLNIMSLAYPEMQMRLYAPRERENDRLRPLLARENIIPSIPDLRLKGSLGRAFWRSVDLPLDLRRDDVMLYHGLSNELPLTIKDVCPTVVTIHDLIWRRSPRDYSAIDRRIYDWKYGRSARIATRVIAISECTRRDLISDFGIPEEKIDVVYQGVDPIFSLPQDTARRTDVRERYKLPLRYILAVGTVQPRKNVLQAVRALPALPADVELLIVGGRMGAYAREVEETVGRLGLKNRVRFMEGVPFTDLPALYAFAEFSSYTSFYEGFGLPVVESLTVGTPVVAATGSCLEEAGGPGALYVDPRSVDEYVDAALRLLDKEGLRKRLSDAGRRYVKKFNADNFALLTMDCYKKAMFGG